MVISWYIDIPWDILIMGRFETKKNKNHGPSFPPYLITIYMTQWMEIRMIGGMIWVLDPAGIKKYGMAIEHLGKSHRFSEKPQGLHRLFDAKAMFDYRGHMIVIQIIHDLGRVWTSCTSFWLMSRSEFFRSRSLMGFLIGWRSQHVQRGIQRCTSGWYFWAVSAGSAEVGPTVGSRKT